MPAKDAGGMFRGDPGDAIGKAHAIERHHVRLAREGGEDPDFVDEALFARGVRLGKRRPNLHQHGTGDAAVQRLVAGKNGPAGRLCDLRGEDEPVQVLFHGFFGGYLRERFGF